MKTKPTLSAPITRRGDQTQNNSLHRKWSALALSGFLFTSIVALSPQVKAGCQQWSANGKWTFIQGSLSVSMDLRQNGTGFTGIARYQAANTEVHGYSVQNFVAGSVDGTLEGNHFAMHVHWSNDTTGVYDGTIRASGIIEGTGYDQRSPSKTVNWYSDAMKCAEAAPVPARPSGRPLPAEPPEKITGVVTKAPGGSSGGIVTSSRPAPWTTSKSSPTPTPAPTGKVPSPTPTPVASAERDESPSSDSEDQGTKHKKKRKHRHVNDEENQGND